MHLCLNFLEVLKGIEGVVRGHCGSSKIIKGGQFWFLMTPIIEREIISQGSISDGRYWDHNYHHPHALSQRFLVGLRIPLLYQGQLCRRPLRLDAYSLGFWGVETQPHLHSFHYAQLLSKHLHIPWKYVDIWEWEVPLRVRLYQFQ